MAITSYIPRNKQYHISTAEGQLSMPDVCRLKHEAEAGGHAHPGHECETPVPAH